MADGFSLVEEVSARGEVAEQAAAPKFPVSSRVAGMSASKTMAVSALAEQLKRAGADVLDAAMTCVQSHSTSNPTSVSQEAAVEALTGPQDSVAEMLRAYRERRDWLVPALNALPGVTCPTPDGAFYAFPSVKGALGQNYVQTSDELTTFLLEEAHVAVTPGEAFGAPGYLRLSYATSLDTLRRAVERIGQALADCRRESNCWPV